MRYISKTAREVMELSRSLPVIDECDADVMLGCEVGEVELSVLDMISYNDSFYVDGHWIRSSAEDILYYGRLVAMGDYQVLRYFALDYRQRSLNARFRYKFGEVAQRWFKDGKQVAFLARKAHNNHWHWCLNTEMSVRKDWDFHELADCKVGSLHPKAFGWGILEKYTESFHPYGGCDISFMFTPFGEFLYKCERELFEKAKQGYYDHLSRYERSVRVAHRHHYEFKDVSMWLDYLDLLHEFGKDILNPHYICPVDLKKEHDAMVARKEAKRRLEEQMRKRKEQYEAEHAEEMYAERMGKYLGLCFSDDALDIKPLRSVKEFMEEGEAMHHCVFANGYYKEGKNCIILSARDKDGKRVETIEVNLKTFKVTQSRGACNETTPYHGEIVGLVERNMGQIRRIATGVAS